MADQDAVAAYVARMDEAVAARVGEVDAAIRRTHSGFDVALKYQILMYAIAKDWRHWVVAIDALLFGLLLSDPRAVLRACSSVLKSWDFKPGAPIDAARIESYVREAVERYPEYRANAEAILAQAHADATAAGRRPK